MRETNPGHGLVDIFQKKVPTVSFTIRVGTNPLLRYAAKPEDLEQLKNAVEKDDINRKISGFRALDIAIINQNTAAIIFLIEHQADPCLVNDNTHESSVSLMLEFNLEKSLKHLIEHQPEILEHDFGKGTHVLHLVAQSRMPDLCALIIRKGASPKVANKLGQTPLHFAAQVQDLDTIKLLIQSGGDPATMDHSNASPLSLSAHWDLYENLAFMLQSPMTPEAIFPALYEAQMHGDPKLIEFLHAHIECCRISTSNTSKHTLLHSATQWNTKYVDYWLLKGGDPNVTNAIQQSPAHLAAMFGYHVTLHSLFTHGATSKAPDFQQNTPMHFAAASGYLNTVKKLCQFGAALDPSNCAKETPFHWASFYAHQSIIAFLLKEAIPQTRDILGYKPKFWTQRRKNLNLLRHLSRPYWQRRYRKPRSVSPLFKVSESKEILPILKKEWRFLNQHLKQDSLLKSRYTGELSAILSELYLALSMEKSPTEKELHIEKGPIYKQLKMFSNIGVSLKRR